MAMVNVYGWDVGRELKSPLKVVEFEVINRNANCEPDVNHAVTWYILAVVSLVLSTIVE